jgi:K(+)-stimulated pyrophosphate-energized sodium pump
LQPACTIFPENILSEDQEDSHGLIAWIIGVAVTIAVTVAVFLGIMTALDSDSSKGKTTTAAIATAPVAPAPLTAPVAPAPVTAPAAAVAAAPLAMPGAAKIYFESNSFATPVDSNKMLADLVSYSKSSANSKLSISGFHDKTGDPAKNQELAKNRAKVVKDLLLSAGVPEDRIMMQKPTETTGGGEDKEARRVEVSAAQ